METCGNSRIRRLFSSAVTEEFIRFAIVGVIATCIHYGIYLVLLRLGHIESELWTNVAYTLGYVVSWFCNLFLTARFTFREKVSLKRGLGFAASHGVNFLLHIAFLNFFIWLGASSQLAPIPVYCIVIPINFILVRTVFKKL